MAEPPGPLLHALHRAGWGPRQLVAAINTRLSRQGRGKYRIDPTAAYSWTKWGYCPRDPIPDVAAAVLSERLGEVVAASDLWPRRRSPGMPTVMAAGDLDQITCLDDLLRQLADLASGTASARTYLAASGADLVAAVLDQLSGTPTQRSRPARESVPELQVELITSHVTALRQLDDRHGGGALSLRYVGAQLRSVIDLVEYANYSPQVGQRLLTTVADLAQLLGWLQFDSGAEAAAQRYLLLSIGVCRSLDARDRAANAIGMLSYVSAFAGHGVEALRLADAALRECPRPSPLLRARLLGREATAAAADGDLSRFRRASDTARQLVVGARDLPVPPFLYYLRPEQLAAEAGQGLIVLAERTTTHRGRLLDEAIDMLSPAVSELAPPAGQPDRPRFPRSALLHRAFLAKAHLMRGNLEQGVATTRDALAHVEQVASPRGRGYLRELRPALARRARSRPVAELLGEFDEALLRT